MKLRHPTLTLLCLAVPALLFSRTAASAVDADAAQALAKKEGCFKCHAIDKTKEAKSLQEIAADIKAKGITNAKLIEHLTTGPKVKLEDGTEEDHKIIKTKDKDAIDNLLAWIRSLAK